MIQETLQLLRSASPLGALGFFLAANFVIFLTSTTGCWLMGQVFSKHRLFTKWEPFSKVELAAAIGATTLNAIASLGGWFLWQADIIQLSTSTGISIALELLLMLLVMDFGMYLLHRLAHHPSLYDKFHSFHHRHEVTNPISLFILHPLEVLGFAGLMIAFLAVYPISIYALILYLTLNVVFGTIGHSGVEPFPGVLRQIPLLKEVGTSTFHAEHHEHPAYNFGFYTLIWDRLFGTLDPEYWDRFLSARKRIKSVTP